MMEAYFDEIVLNVEYGSDTEEPLNPTREQKLALYRKWQQDNQELTFAEFAATAQLTFGMDGAIVIKWCNMFLVIETDGYTHS